MVNKTIQLIDSVFFLFSILQKIGFSSSVQFGDNDHGNSEFTEQNMQNFMVPNSYFTCNINLYGYNDVMVTMNTY